MRLLLLGPQEHLSGGVNTFISLLRQELQQQNIEVHYFYVGKTGSIGKDALYPFFWMVDMIRLKKIINDLKPDVVHINPSLTTTAIFRDFLFLKIIKKEGYPVLFFIHGWRKEISHMFRNILGKNFFRKRFEMADEIVVLAQQFKDALVALGVNSKKIFISSTMVRSSEYAPDEKTFSRPYNVLFCSTIKKSKGPFELLNTIPYVITKYQDTSFTFVGDGKDLEKLKRKTREMDIGNNVMFTGYRTGNEKISLFKQAHIFVLPSYSEGFPTVVLEAMAAGLPLILTPVGGLVHSIEDGKQGLMLRSEIPDSLEIAQNIISFIENPDLMKKISNHNIREARDRYDTKIVTKKIIERYKELCAEKG